MVRRRLLLSWSSGKDSAWTLHRLREHGEFAVAGLVTAFNADADRVAMHGVRRALVEAQAEAAGLPLHWLPLPGDCTNAVYESRMHAFLLAAAADGITHVAFGDLFLQDIRDYRERLLAGTGITPVFPLWREDTRALAEQMIANGLRAHLTCTDTRKLGPAFAGRAFDGELLRELPADVDPCGENGEFHTFCWDGPMFARAIGVRCGHNVQRNEFLFTDLLPADGS